MGIFKTKRRGELSKVTKDIKTDRDANMKRSFQNFTYPTLI